MQITVNVCRTWRARSLGLRQGSEEGRQNEIPPQDAPSAMLGATDHINALDLRQALLTLSADMRQVIVLRFYVGMDSTEIGELLSESPATVRGRLRRAVIQLRRTLGDALPALLRHAPPHVGLCTKSLSELPAAYGEKMRFAHRTARCQTG